MAYSSGDFLARVTLKSTTGLPADNITNDFAFSMDDELAPSSGDLSACATNLYDFYTHNNNTHQIAYYLGAVDRTYFDVKFWSIVVGDLGSPIGDVVTSGGGTITAAGASAGLPAEVAACLSFHGDLTDVPLETDGGTVRPAARRRGRVYIGPLNTTANDTAGYTRLSSGFQNDIAASASVLIDDSTADGMHWCVWSRMDTVLYPVVGGFVDNEFDTQRRRGSKATGRVNWS